MPRFLSCSLHEYELGWLYDSLGIQRLNRYNSINDALAITSIRETFTQAKMNLEGINHGKAIFPAEIDTESNTAQHFKARSETDCF